jgi:hypothetical protein
MPMQIRPHSFRFGFIVYHIPMKTSFIASAFLFFTMQAWCLWKWCYLVYLFSCDYLVVQS